MWISFKQAPIFTVSRKCYVLLSKFGDVIQSLPIIEREFKKTNKKPDVVTSEKFASVFEGISYVNKVIIFKGKWSDLHGAIKFAKTMFSDVTVLQCHGENFPFQHTKPSFQHEVYDRVGLLNEWQDLRPMFDRRDSMRENALLYGYGLVDKKEFICESSHGQKENLDIEISKRFILLADQSESSQFKHIEELKVMLGTKFGSSYKIILLSELKAHKIYDLLAIYERAAALVATETVHTHLAWATNVPMFVLSADGWRGSGMRKAFKFYIKYADWERRKNDLIESLDNFLKDSEVKKTTVFQTDKPWGYNLSSVMFNGKPIYAYRYHSGGWKTKLMICSEGKQFPLQVDPAIENFSHEDLRAFVFEGKLFGIYTVAAEINGYWKCYQAYGEITNDGDQWRIGHIQIKYVGNDFSGTTKNWVPWVHDGKINVIYGIRGSDQVVLELDYDRIRVAHNSPAPRWEHGEIRGGVILPHGDALLRFFHSRKDYPDKTICYFVGCALMEAKPPFKTLKVCNAPILYGDDEFVPNCKHWKGRVSFALGAIQSGDKNLLSFGHNDCGCRITELSKSDLNL